ncbi:heterokaryon incompatibility protein-domain-containing protein [Fusarium tricinctum]|uniref:Heterokaryon incompatibility protein-domain-containing protein n=1 Tax=Fusarium tricinctum TaxID=61284 RepID=A0A8K0WC23_9HYPO|nr:heterokaryon incompatibility protein-domain-containing protein [Fusarium tricinctum]
MPRFQYLPLLPLELRLLELQPGFPDDPLVGVILRQKLSPQDNEIPEFEALSYCWGSQSQPDSINLTLKRYPDERSLRQDTGSINVGQNLAAALRALRQPSEKRILWCDSICINQEDIKERSAQVQRMHDIYHQARRVIVWWGPDTSWGPLLMETLRWAGKQLKAVTLTFAVGNIAYTRSDTSDNRLWEDNTPLPLNLDQWRAVEQLVALDWHKRLWTYQEIVLANQQTSVVRLGIQEMPWAEFKDALLFILSFKPPPPGVILDLASYVFNTEAFSSRAFQCLCNFDRYTQDNWIHAIRMATPYLCSDDRDRVYASRGLISPSVADSIEPDYSKSAKEIFTAVCLDHIARHKDLEFLNACNAATSPSWVADLERPLGQLCLDANAGGKSAASATLIKPGVLEVAGVSCDRICSNPLVLPGRKFLQPDAEFIQATVNVFQSLGGNSLLHDDYLDKLILMLTYGAVRDHSIEKLQPVSSSSLFSLEDWRKKIREWLSGTFDEKPYMKNFRETDNEFLRTLPVGNTATGCLETLGGSFIRVPPESRSGDIVAVFLGSKTAMVLRPQTKPNSYLVIGPAYHPEFCEGQAFLGDDFHGWDRLWERQWVISTFHKEGQPLRRTDPRLDQVPYDGDITGFITTDHNFPFWGHLNDAHREVLFQDPRMSEASLVKRGVPVQRFQLV